MAILLFSGRKELSILTHILLHLSSVPLGQLYPSSPHPLRPSHVLLGMIFPETFRHISPPGRVEGCTLRQGGRRPRYMSCTRERIPSGLAFFGSRSQILTRVGQNPKSDTCQQGAPSGQGTSNYI
eukprot:582165-Amorphochlora_amoeboformis.AAC.2